MRIILESSKWVLITQSTWLQLRWILRTTIWWAKVKTQSATLMWAKVCIHKKYQWTWVLAPQSIEVLVMMIRQGPQLWTGADRIPSRSTRSAARLTRSRSRNYVFCLSRKASMIKLQGMYHLANQPWARMAATILELCDNVEELAGRVSSQLKIKIRKNWTHHSQKKWRAKTKLMNILGLDEEEAAELEVKRVRVAITILFLNLNSKYNNIHRRASNFLTKCLKNREKAAPDHDQELRLTNKTML